MKIYLPGHSWILHALVSVNWPVHVPPLASSTSFSLVSILVPVPQVFEHSPCIQSSQTQWIAKICKSVLNILFKVFSYIVVNLSMIHSLLSITWTVFHITSLFSLISIWITGSSISFYFCFGSSIDSSSSPTGDRALS